MEDGEPDITEDPYTIQMIEGVLVSSSRAGRKDLAIALPETVKGGEKQSMMRSRMSHGTESKMKKFSKR